MDTQRFQWGAWSAAALSSPAMTFDVALIGFGEAGRSFALAGGWRERATAYDRKTEDAATRDRTLADYASAGIVDSRDAARAANASAVVLSLVTADQAIVAARAAAGGLRPGALFCDGNSVAPETKRMAARIVEDAGARYIDMAILAPVNPARLDVPILLSGAAASDARAALDRLGFAAIQLAGKTVGRASSIKMIRSVMVKGVEALTAECVLAAARAGVLDEVLASLDRSDRIQQWRARADYNLDRMAVHGLRRAAEMEEVSKTLVDLGIEPVMTRGTIARQRELGLLGAIPPADGLDAKLAQISHLAERGIKAA